ncbi:MAG: hypothetical protein ACREOE_19270, partial [Gemmatimonadales bacterium]
LQPLTRTPHSERWPVDQLREFGLELVGFVRAPSGYQVLRLASPCPDRFPRRDGIPQKRPWY